MTQDLIRDLSRTEAAIAAFDKYQDEHDLMSMSSEDCLKAGAELDKLEEAVGHAFGLDTADRNKMEDCVKHIRPGPRSPAPGYELSFVRKAVAGWRQRLAASGGS